MTTTTLSLSHQKFVQAYLRRPNAAAAYRLAYPGAGQGTARQAGPRLLKRPEVTAELTRLREIGQAAAVLDLARKRAWLAGIVNDPGQKTGDRLRALKLDAELAGDLEVSLFNEKEAELYEALEEIRKITHGEWQKESTTEADLGGGI